MRLTQADLASSVGRSQSAIAQLEAGLIDGSDGLIRQIAAVTGFPIEFFDRDSGPSFPAGSLLFRAHANINRKDRLEAYSQARFVFEMLVSLLERASRIPINLPKSSDAPVAAARAVRRFLKIDPVEPIGNLLATLERNGVLVLALPDLKGRDAFSLWAGDDRSLPVVAISHGRPGDRLRMTVAHELGHLVLHSVRDNVTSAAEDQANEFAAEFLMPEAAMRRELSAPLTLTRLATLKPKWRVSIQAMVVRAKELGIITDRQYRYLYEQIGIQGWKTSEPVNLAVEPERPRTLRQLAEMFYGSPIDTNKLAKDSALPERLVRQILSNYRERKAGTEGAKLSPKIVALKRRME
jgi:Zn-dependent peptidase ImmA (M78 family)